MAWFTELKGVSATHRDELHAAEVALLYEQARPAILGAFISAGVLVAALWDHAHHVTLLAWLTTYAVIQVFRYGLSRAFLGNLGVMEDARPWERRLVVLTALSGLVWGLAGAVFYPEASPVHQFLLLLFIAGISSAAAATYAASAACYSSTILAALVPPSVRAFAEANETGFILGCAMSCYVVILLMSAGNTRRMIRETLRLRFDKDGLILLLSEEKKRVEVLNDDLRREVAERERVHKELIEARNGLEDRVRERTAQLASANELLRREIEERKQADHALLESRTRCAMLMENSPLGIIACDAKGSALEANSRGLAVVGMQSEAELAECSLLTLPALVGTGISADLQRLLRTGKTTVVERWHLQEGSNRRKLRAHLAALRDQEGRILGAQVIVEDVTERVLMEAELRTSEARFRGVFESAQDLMFVKSVDLTYTHVNQAMLEMLNLPESQVVGKSDEAVLSAEAARHARNIESRVLRGDHVEEEHTVTSRGITMTFNWLRFPIRAASGRICGICGIGRDVTDRRRRELPPKTDRYLSKSMEEALEKIRFAAPSDSTVVLLGESGSGKDYWARYLHDNSPRSDRPFISINCAALPADLVESELFGHEKGAFTGALTRKRGLVELAEGGTVLLNEIGELPLRLQAKLLTFLDTNSFMRVGGETSITVDVRITAATNRDLETEVAAGNFRKDLFYRLNVFSVTIPPLRSRVDDIPILVEEFLDSMAKRAGLQASPAVHHKAMRLLLDYHWPGNVRELKNVLERALLVGNKVQITPRDLGIIGPEKDEPAITQGDSCFTVQLTNGLTMPSVLHSAKQWLVAQALRRSGGQLDDAARQLGITRDSLKHHMKSLAIKRTDWTNGKSG